MRTRLFVGTLALGVASLFVAAGSALAQQGAGQGPSVNDNAALQLDSGTRVSVTVQQAVTSAKTHVGDTVSAVIDSNVMSRDGRVVLPKGTEATLRVTALEAPMPHRDDARILLELVSAAAGGQSHALRSNHVVAVKAPIVSQRLAGSAEPTEFAIPQGTAVVFELGA